MRWGAAVAALSCSKLFFFPFWPAWGGMLNPAAFLLVEENTPQNLGQYGLIILSTIAFLIAPEQEPMSGTED